MSIYIPPPNYSIMQVQRVGFCLYPHVPLTVPWSYYDTSLHPQYKQYQPLFHSWSQRFCVKWLLAQKTLKVMVISTDTFSNFTLVKMLSPFKFRSPVTIKRILIVCSVVMMQAQSLSWVWHDGEGKIRSPSIGQGFSKVQTGPWASVMDLDVFLPA